MPASSFVAILAFPIHTTYYLEDSSSRPPTDLWTKGWKIEGGSETRDEGEEEGGDVNKWE